MRTEMLGTAYTAQHSDCRVLEQLCLGTGKEHVGGMTYHACDWHLWKATV